MDQSYWVLEYGKVLLAYLLVMYLWPSVVFRTHLRGKSRAYRFCFCVNVSLLLLHTGILLLGLLRLLNQTLVAVLFWGVFAVQLFRNLRPGFSWLGDLKSVFNRTMTPRRMLLKWRSANVGRLRTALGSWWRSTRGSRVEYGVLGLLVLFATAYFSTNALQVHSFAFSDQYVHHAWTYSLTQGKIFSGGIYPEGMHCLAYALSTVFPVHLYSVLLFLGCIHVHLLVISAYLLSKKLFRWKLSGLFAIAAFLTLDQPQVFIISRLVGTLPQEFALYTVFMTAYGLIGFLQKKPEALSGRFRFFRLASWREFFSDGYLFIFITALAVSLCVHFYATIMAFYICIVALLLNLRRLFRRGSLSRLVMGALIALLVAVLPMAAALAEGYPLQGSLYWAMAVTEKSTTAVQSALEGGTAHLSLLKTARRFVNGTYLQLYGKTQGRLLLWTDLLVGGLSLILLSVFSVRSLGRKRENEGLQTWAEAFKGYLFTALCVVVLMIANRPGLLKLPALIDGSRICSILGLFSMLLYTCVLDLVFALAGCAVRERYLKPVSALVCLGIYVLARGTGLFHGYLGSALTRYPVAVELTKEITEHMPKGQYTIISTTDEQYQVIETGFHEEWIDFLEKSTDEKYTIPTPYLFFFIEKHPLQYVQRNFASGPSWLAAEKYVTGRNWAQYPEIFHGEVSDEAAAMEFTNVKKSSDTAVNLHNRTILESRAYQWYERFSSIYPNEGRVIFEDEDFLCYCVHQNEHSLFSLGVMDG